ncbi:HD domain-containing protein [Candidatus Kaiserbacteria bacterium]|nr:HD domain-containing protein [Candidatus Kaiserbacteria bacterium]
MNLEEFTEERVIEEANKILYLYTLKHVIRYGQTRKENDYTESVGEHIFGMHILADYFRPLEDPDNKLDMTKVYQLITWHELDEIETGDIPANYKTEADRAYATKIIPEIINKIPDSLQNIAQAMSDEYESAKTPEAKYVKAIDKIEPLIHSFDIRGKIVQQELKHTMKKSIAVKEKHIKDFPFIKHFSDTLHKVMEEKGYFYQET